MLNNQWFWNEVKLLAKNNYGSWSNKEEAREIVLQAIRDTLKEIEERFANQPGTINKVVNEMIETT